MIFILKYRYYNIEVTELDYIDYINYKLNGKYIGLKQSTNNSSDVNHIDFLTDDKVDVFYSTLYNIDEGLEKDYFILYFQPQYDLSNNKLIGVEALVRLKDKDGNLIPPKDFIPIAECTDRIIRLDQWIVKSALRHKKLWEDKGYKDIYLSINLSAKSLMDEINFKKILDIITSFDINYNQLVFEITETAIISDPDLASKNLQSLKELGINIALDDFGTGFSSISHLEKLPIDIVKFDRSFINKIPNNTKSCYILDAILKLSHNLGYIVVAEGIENINQLKYLASLNCDRGQGFFFSKPMPHTELLGLK
ncbi:MAG: EAL domain-containing protein [Clostridiales bacterium]|nr:EAL domain-containing protein [Clostridiales bacterium]